MAGCLCGKESAMASQRTMGDTLRPVVTVGRQYAGGGSSGFPSPFDVGEPVLVPIAPTTTAQAKAPMILLAVLAVAVGYLYYTRRR